MRDLKDLAFGAYLTVKYAAIVAAIALVFIGPGVLAGNLSPWWLFLYTPHALFILWVAGADTREKDGGYHL